MRLKPVELKAGQVSLHHPRIVHGSGVNKSNDRRIGFVIQSYIGTNVNKHWVKMEFKSLEVKINSIIMK
jgi:ectoine hydroxylase-related dioxygenase (phytanoyl-CoA dioxygenase family)